MHSAIRKLIIVGSVVTAGTLFQSAAVAQGRETAATPSSDTLQLSAAKQSAFLNSVTSKYEKLSDKVMSTTRRDLARLQKEVAKNIRQSPQKVVDVTTKGLTNQKVDEVKRQTNLQ